MTAKITKNASYYSLEEIARKLSIHVNTVRNLIRARKLPAVKVGHQWRVSKADLVAYLEENTRRAFDEMPEFQRQQRPKVTIEKITKFAPEDVIYPVDTDPYVDEDDLALFDE